MSAEMERLRAEFDKFQSRLKHAEQQFGNVDEMREQIKELESVATSPERGVRVVAGPGGTIKDIRISGEAMRQQPGALSAEVLSTVHQAVAAAAQQQAAIVDRTMGGAIGGSVTDQVLQSQAEAFGTTVDELKKRAAGTNTTAPGAPPAAGGTEPGRASVFDSPSPDVPAAPAPTTPDAPPPSAPPATPPAASTPPSPAPRHEQDWDDDEYGHGSVFER